MKKTYLVLPIAAFVFCALLPASPVQSKEEKKQPTPAEQRAQLGKEVQDTIAGYGKADPGMDRFFKESAGYVVFPRIGKVGFIFGGGNGMGEVYEKGQLAGTASITLATVGLQVGALEFSEVIFFSDAAAIARFKQNKFEFTANVSAVIVKACLLYTSPSPRD